MDANFADPIQDPTSGETAILTLGTLAEGSTFSFEHWDSGRMGTETSALLAGTETAWLNLYGITDGSESVGSQQSLLPRSTWLKVTSGRYNRIVGGRTNGHAGNISEGSGNGANTVTGDFNVQLSGQGTTARNIIGGFYGTGDGYNNDADGAANTPCTLTGDTKVVVTDGATVTGGIIGGSAVRFVAGNKDQHIDFTHKGNSSVTVHYVLAAPTTDTAHNVTYAGVKPMGIVGGDLNVDIGSLKDRGSVITGNTSVTVEIPSESGDFAMPIYGASVRATAGKAAQESFTQRVGGNSSVTIDAPDVTFSADIVAGGSGPSVTVAGAATLSADTLTLDGASTLHLGTKPYSFRYVRFTFTGVVGNQEGLVLFDLELLRDGEKVPWNGATGTNDAARLMDGTSNNWSKAHPTATIPVCVAFDAGDGKVFTFDGYRFMSSYFKSRTPTTWTVEGSNDNATWQVLDSRNYDADTVRAWFAGRETEPNGDTDKISLTWTPAQTMIDDAVTARYVRWVPTHRVAGSNSWMGLAEFQLLHNGEPVAWPSGTADNAGSAIHQPHPAGSGTNAASTNEVDG